MIKKLRRKIFWSIEGSALIILFLILIVYNVLHYANNEKQEWQMLSVVAQSVCENMGFQQEFSEGFGGLDRHFGDKGAGRMQKKGGKKTAEIVNGLVSGDIAVVLLDNQGNAESVTGFLEEYSLEDRDSLLDKILSKSTEQGRAGKYKYRYLQEGNYNVIAVLDAGYVNADTVMMALISFLGLLVSGAIFAMIARRLSVLIVKPVEETIANQKQFVADASHELKTPVSVMLANISVLEKEMGKNRWMDYIKEEGKRMSDLTNHLLLLSRIDYEQETSEHSEEKISFNLSDACMEAALPFESIAFEQGIRYEIEVPENIYTKGVRQEVKQIVGILIDNALKHVNDKGTVELAIREIQERKGLKTISHAAICVRNTGEGIEKEALPYIFNRFYKVDSSRQYQENSFGLGLAIAKSLTEKNDGVITVSSDSEITEFTVLFHANVS